MKRMFATVVVVLAIAGCATGQKPARTGSVALPTPALTPTMSPSDAPPSATPMASFEVNGQRIAAGTHTATPWTALEEPSASVSARPGCTETADDDSIRITFTVPDGWALAEEVAVSKPSASRVAPGRDEPSLSPRRLAVQRPLPHGRWTSRTSRSGRRRTTSPTRSPLIHSSTRRRRSKPCSAGTPGSTSTFSCRPTSPSVSFGYLPWAPAFYAQGPNHRWHVWSLDVDGVRVVIQNGDFPGTLPEDLAEMHAIIESHPDRAVTRGCR